MSIDLIAFAQAVIHRCDPRRRSDADAVAGLSHHRAAAGARPVRTVPDRRGVAL